MMRKRINPLGLYAQFCRRKIRRSGSLPAAASPKSVGRYTSARLLERHGVSFARPRAMAIRSAAPSAATPVLPSARC